MNISPQSPYSRQSGFTLIELSIVLVIIGLIIGSILVGQDMIAAANIRAQLSQIDKYNAAVNTFKAKYGGLPGDIIPTQASAFSFATRTGGTGRGNGNGVIEGGETNGIEPAGEGALFWADLTVAGLIDGNFQGTDCTFNTGTCTASTGGGGGTLLLGQIIPPAKIGQANYLLIAPNADGRNYYLLLSGKGEYITSNGTFTGPGNLLGLTPQQAYTIDSKIDDGYPTSGVVKSAEISSDVAPVDVGPAGAASAADCGNTDTSPTSYNTGLQYASLLACMLIIRAGF